MLDEETGSGGLAIEAAPGTGAEAGAGQLTMLEGLEEEMVGGDTAEQGGDKAAGMELDSEGDEMTRAYDPPVSLNWELAAQYKEAQRLQR